MHSRMGARREHASDICMTIVTRLVSHIRGAWNLRRGHDGSCNGRAGIEQQTHGHKRAEHEQSTLLSASVHNRFIVGLLLPAAEVASSTFEQKRKTRIKRFAFDLLYEASGTDLFQMRPRHSSFPGPPLDFATRTSDFGPACLGSIAKHSSS